jgi:hypothetical protein
MNLLQKSLSALGAATMLVFSSAASAVPFTVTAAQFSTVGPGYGQDGDEDPGNLLDVRFSTSVFTQQNFVLGALNQQFTFNFGTIDMQEPNAHGAILAGETEGLGITATLTFTAPAGVTQTITANGVATVGSVSDSAVDYVIDWSPVTIMFGNGGSFQLSLTDMSFSGLGAQFQTATVTLLSFADGVPANNVPEPASIALLGIGIGFVAVARRRRAKA